MNKQDKEPKFSDNSFKESLNDAMGDMSAMINSGFGVLSGARQELKELVKTWVEASLQRLAVPTREEIESLEARVDILQKKVAKLEQKKTTKSNV